MTTSISEDIQYYVMLSFTQQESVIPQQALDLVDFTHVAIVSEVNIRLVATDDQSSCFVVCSIHEATTRFSQTWVCTF